MTITFDITQTNRAVRRAIEMTDNPRHKYLLQAYDRHRNLEMAGRYPEIFTPEMTVEHPVYHFHILGKTMVLNGAEEVRNVYHAWTESAECVFYTGGEKIAVSDDMIVSTSIMYQQHPGAALVAEGVPVDPDRTYLLKTAEHMIWPYDDQGRLAGEDVWEYDETVREIIPLEPEDVLTVAQARAQLDPLIHPLPAHNPFLD